MCRVVACLLILVLPGCFLDDGPDVALVITHFEHVGASDQGIHLAPASVGVAAAPGGMRVDGTITLPDHCDVLHAEIGLDEGDLELRLRARRTDEPGDRCDLRERTVIVRYTATIDRLPPDRYPFRVVYQSHSTHARGAIGRSALEETLYEDTVVID